MIYFSTIDSNVQKKFYEEYCGLLQKLVGNTPNTDSNNHANGNINRIIGIDG
jgi:hypothetical protein